MKQDTKAVVGFVTAAAFTVMLNIAFWGGLLYGGYYLISSYNQNETKKCVASCVTGGKDATYCKEEICK